MHTRAASAVLRDGPTGFVAGSDCVYSSVPPALFPDRRTSMADEWPLRDYLELGALPGAVPSARLHTRQLLWEWGVFELGETVELVVSELMTNAVSASRTMREISPVRLWLLSDNKRVMVMVWDANPEPPVRIESSADAESGRGLLLVEAMSKQWNWHVPMGMGGKVVWAQCEM